MARMLTEKDFDMTDIGTRFEVDEVIPNFAQEERTDDSGNVILDSNGKPRKFHTDEIIGYSYNVTIKDGRFKKKSTQIKVMQLDPLCTNDDVMSEDEILVGFENIQLSFNGKALYYKADNIFFLDNKK